MDDSHGSLTPWLRRIKRQLGGSDDDTGSREESGWKKYGNLIQIAATLLIAFGGVFSGVAATVLDRTTSIVGATGAAVSGFLWPVLVAVTAVAVAVCVVVVALGIRNA